PTVSPLVALCGICLLSLSSPGIRPALHSLPTRRSSDLAAGGQLLCGLDHRRESRHAVAGHRDAVKADHRDIVRHFIPGARQRPEDRKSTRLNSSHVSISYAVFCLKKKREEDA